MADRSLGDVRDVTIGPKRLEGVLGLPANARGIVIFAHGSGSGRFSPRNNYVATELRRAGLATLLLDLLTPEEERDRSNVFDIPLLASRLEQASNWASDNEETAGLSQGFFGASTGAGAALMAAAIPGTPVSAVVSRGGRPDLASSSLPYVRAPTLLLVGSLDSAVIEMNREAYQALSCDKDLTIIEGASHLFEEPGKLDDVVHHAATWFLGYLSTDETETT